MCTYMCVCECVHACVCVCVCVLTNGLIENSTSSVCSDEVFILSHGGVIMVVVYQVHVNTRPLITAGTIYKFIT